MPIASKTTTEIKNLYWAILLGNCLTKYNQALFWLLGPTWATTLFHNDSPIVNLMLAYSFFLVDWIARPLGAVFWGWLADCHNLSKALCYSFWGITVSTISLSILPTLAPVNHIAAIGILMLRLFYSFFATGETTNGAILLLNYSNFYQRNWSNSLHDISSTLGSLLATMGLVVLNNMGYLKHRWYLLFYLSSILCIIALSLRMNISVDKVAQKSKINNISLSAIARHHWMHLLALMAASGFSYATYLFSFVFLQGYLPLTGSSVSYQRLLEINVLLIFLDILLLPLFAKLANILGYRSQMLGSTMIMLLSMPFLLYLMEQATVMTIFFCRLWVTILGVAFSCTYHVWAQSLSSSQLQCRLSALGYTLGSRIIGMPILVTSLWLFQKTSLIGAPVLYLGFTAALALIALYSTKSLKSF